MATIPTELLAPAGDWDCLRAAVAAGADAVYFGLPRFSARHRATNFQPDELPAIMTFLHNHNVRGLVALNTLIFPDELKDIAEYLGQIADAKVDAVIVQDLGLAHLIGELAPTVAVHASTQMTLTEPRAVAWAASRLGVQRAVLARELSIEEITKITSTVDLPVEVFVHGALCVAYSGQCLTSEALGGRSANRGQCAQACRLPYELIVDGVAKPMGDRAYLLSPQDLGAWEQIAPLLAAGVTSFKIEGRLKTPHYVAAAVQAYRSAIDAAIAGKKFTLDPIAEHDINLTFSRGFTTGFLEGNNHQRLVQARFPKSRGLLVGEVKQVYGKNIRIKLSDANWLKIGDGIVLDLGRPGDKEPGGRVAKLSASKNQPTDIEISLYGDIDLKDVHNGCRVWKTDDPATRKRLEIVWSRDLTTHRRALHVHLSGRVGERLTLAVRDEAGHTAEASWPGPLELARKNPLTAETAREQLDRLGDTPYELGEVVLDLGGAVMVPKSVLNELRRQALETIQTAQAIPAVAARAIRPMPPLELPTGTPAPEVPGLSFVCRTMEQLKALCAWTPPEGLSKPTMLWADFEDPRGYKHAVETARAAGIPVGLATLRIIKPGEEGFLSLIRTASPDAVLVRNLGGMLRFREELPEIPRVADFSFNVANERTAALLIEEGLSWLVPSFDLNWDQMSSMIQRAKPNWFEAVIHQHMPMFHMEHCVFAAFLSKGKDHRDCGRPCDRHQIDLKDRIGSQFPVLADAGCRNTVFNAIAQSAAEYIPRMLALGLKRFRVDLLRDDPEKTIELAEVYGKILAGQDNGGGTWRKLQTLDQLGVTRGTLQLV